MMSERRKFKFHVSKTGKTVFVRDFPRTVRRSDLVVLIPMLQAMEKGMVVDATYRR